VTSDEQKDKSRAFSLLEMMAVVCIIMILATIAMPMYRTMIVHAHEAVLREDLFTMRCQIDRFTQDNERGPTTLQELVDKGYMGNIPVDPFTGSNETWQVVTKEEPLVADSSTPLGIVNVHSGADGVSLGGTEYSQW
jgi:general secretion pathway protein G